MDKFHNHNNVVITAKDKISSANLEKFVKQNFKNFYKGSRIRIFCGLHHRKNPTDGTVQVGEFDEDLVNEFKVE